jgi:hypothetical protein
MRSNTTSHCGAARPRPRKEAQVKLDAHVHTRYPGRTSLYPLNLIMRES